MKKIVQLILYLIICLLLLTTYVNAQDEACKITLSSDKTSVNPGEEVTITILMSNITKASGISNILSVLEYSEDVLQVELVQDNELSANLSETEFKDCDILYSGIQDTDTTIKNPWYILQVKSNGNKGIYGSTMADPQIETQIIGKIKFKVKDNSNVVNTKIALKETEVFDADTISNGNASGYKIADSNIEININVPSQNTTTNNNQSTENKQVQQENIAQGEAPYTGIEDVVPIIIAVSAISIILYIKYKKYNNI